jgi:hypothetical protein
VCLGYADQIAIARNTALIRGCPNIRWVDVPRAGTGEERVATFLDQAIAALTDPLTDKEKESGLYVAPPPQRILFEGTLLDAQDFYQATTPVANCRNCPIAKYTDGLPIVIPTEEAVREVLTGTGHTPQEAIYRYTRDATTGIINKTTSAAVYAGAYNATVEQVAVIATMAGAKPEYLPVILAISTFGGDTACPGTSSSYAALFIANGPIVKDIGMNSGQLALDYGNPVNSIIRKSVIMMTVNLMQCYPGFPRSTAGNPSQAATMAEDEDALPPGWETLAEMGGFKRTDSVIAKIGSPHMYVNSHWGADASAFRGLNDGVGGIARALGVEGKPGFYNFLEYVAPLLYPRTGPSNHTFIMHPDLAKALSDYGFKTKTAVSNWLRDTQKVTAAQYRKYGDYDFLTNSGRNILTGAGIAYNDLPANFLITVFTGSYFAVGISNADEEIWGLQGGPTYLPVDPWR